MSDDFPDVKLKALVSFPATILDGTGIDVVKQGGSYQFNIAFDDFAPPVGGIADPTHQNALLWNSLTGSYTLVPISVIASGGAVPEAPNDGVQYGRQSLTWSPIISGGTPSSTNPAMDGVAAPGALTTYSRGDHVHPSDTSRQPIDTDLTAIAALSGTGLARRTSVTPTWSVGAAISNAELAAMAPFTLKGNNSASSNVPGDVDIAVLTTKASPAGGDFLLLSDQAASGAWKKISISTLPGASGGITDAPNDGQMYGRQSLGWAAITGGGGASPSNSNPAMNGVVNAGVSLLYSRGDHVHPTDTSLAPLASPTFTGDPKAPTPTVGDNDTSIATTAFVTTAVAGYAPIASPTFTGDPKAPTPTAGDNDTSIATTAFVTAAVAAGGGGTGAVRYDISQGLTAPQQTQGRQNISAAPFDAALAANLVINGAMDVSQENGTTQVTVTTGALKWVVDQFWIAYLHTANTAVFKGQQVAPPGSPNLGTAFPNCLQLTATTLSAMAGAGDFAAIATAIEGYRIARLGFGSATNLSPVTIGFWVYATIAGTMTVAIRNSATDRSYPANITINSPLTWEYKTVTIPGDATGTWLNTNGVGFYLTFCFGSNTTMQGANNTWSAGNFFATSATTNFFASNGNTVCLTGVSMWKGTEAPTAGRSALAMRTFDQEKFLCKRYYQFGQVTVDFLAVATTWVGTASFATSPEMRTVPVLSNVAGATANNVLSATPVQPSPIGAAQQVMPSAAGNVRTYWYGSILCDARLS